MKTKSRIAIAAAATLLAGVAVASLPAAAHDRTGSSGSGSTSHSQQDRTHATASATITGIPATVTSSHEASRGAYFTVYQLSASATAVPASEPTTGGKRIGVKADRKAAEPVISGTTLTATLGFPADVAGTSKYALYPSDGTAAILVTVNVSDTGVATVTTSRALTVAYSATVAAEQPQGPREEAGNGKRDGNKGKGKGGKPEGGKGGKGGKGHGPRH
jgi:hypothetical protein